VVAHATAIGGLIVGGLIAAPLAGYVVKVVPVRAMTWMVGGLVLILAGWQTAKLAGLV